MDSQPMPATPSVSVIIPTWNTRETTLRCLDSLAACLRMTHEIIVVDNGSRDGTKEAIAEWAARTGLAPILITNPANRGYAAACNQGAAVATGRDMWVLLNSDTIVTEGWDIALLIALQDPSEKVAAAGPMSNRVSGDQLVPECSYSSPQELQRFADERSVKHLGERQFTNRLVGFCLAVSPLAWREIGGFDEQFFPGNFDDDDWCLRAVAAGWKLVIAHDAFVHHESGATFVANRVDYQQVMILNEQRFARKWNGGLQSNL